MTTNSSYSSSKSTNQDARFIEAVQATLFFTLKPETATQKRLLAQFAEILWRLSGVKAIGNALTPWVVHGNRMRSNTGEGDFPSPIHSREFTAVQVPFAMATASLLANFDLGARHDKTVEDFFSIADKLDRAFNGRKSPQGSFIVALSDALHYSQTIEASVTLPDELASRRSIPAKKGTVFSNAKLAEIYLEDHDEHDVLEIIKQGIAGPSRNLRDRHYLDELAKSFWMLHDVPILGEAIIAWIHWTKGINAATKAARKELVVSTGATENGWLKDLYVAEFRSYWTWNGYPHVHYPRGRIDSMGDHLQISIDAQLIDPTKVLRPISLEEKARGRASFRVSAALNRILANHIPLSTQLSNKIQSHMRLAEDILNGSSTTEWPITPISLGDMERICDEIDHHCRLFITRKH